MAQTTTRKSLTGLDHSVKKIQPAYRQIADQISDLIIGGTLHPGEQLPTEEGLASSFGVSRNTVREALRILSSQGLVYTTRGVMGGTFVAQPDADAVQSAFETNLGLLSGAHRLDRHELFEVRSVLEVPATRWAAERRTSEDLDALRYHAEANSAGRDVPTRVVTSSGFHEAVLTAAGNRLLQMITPPLWRVFRRLSEEEGVRKEVWPDIDDDHNSILEFIEAGKGDEAADAMAFHLVRLRENNG